MQTQILTTIPETLRLVTSDLGDGGWSLHDARDTDEMLASGESIVLASGDGPILAIDLAHAVEDHGAVRRGTRAAVHVSECPTCIERMFARLG